MRLLNEGNLKALIADDGKVLKSKDDNYEAEHIDENGNKVEEYIPYYFTKAYVPQSTSLEMCLEQYDEILESEKIEREMIGNVGTSETI